MTSYTKVQMLLSELLELYHATNKDEKQELRVAYNPRGFRYVNLVGTYSAAGTLLSVSYGVLDEANDVTVPYKRRPDFQVNVNIPNPEPEIDVKRPRAIVEARIRPEAQAQVVGGPKIDGWVAAVNVSLVGMTIAKSHWFATEAEAEEFATSEAEKYDQLYNYPPPPEATWQTVYSNRPDPDEFL